MSVRILSMNLEYRRRKNQQMTQV